MAIQTSSNEHKNNIMNWVAKRELFQGLFAKTIKIQKGASTHEAPDNPKLIIKRVTTRFVLP